MDQTNGIDAEAAKSLVYQYFQRLLNARDLSVCDEMLSDAYVDHDAPSDTPPGPKNIKEFVAGFLREYPNLSVQVLDVVAERNRVAARLVWRGSHRDSREELHRMGIIILLLDGDGRFVERWSAYKDLN